MLVGFCIVFFAVVLWLIAKSIGPTVKDGLVAIGVWAITMAALASPAGVVMRVALISQLSNTTKNAILVIALFAFLLAFAVGWRRFRDQKAAVKKVLPEPPKTSFKRRLDRSL